LSLQRHKILVKNRWQCTSLDCSLTKLCRDLAKVSIENGDAEGLLVVIRGILAAAVLAASSKRY
jgi:hypothetical protein